MPELGWLPRERPLPAAAAIAGGALALELARRLLEDPQASRFRAAAAPGCLMIAGHDLPWLDGIVYLGVDRGAPSLWLPTQLEPDFPLDLLEAAIRRLGQPLPCVVLPDSDVSPLHFSPAAESSATRWKAPGGLKGRDRTAQGEALGGKVGKDCALKGRDLPPTAEIAPLQGAELNSPFLPRASPWAVRSRPFRPPGAAQFQSTGAGGSAPILFSAHDLRPLDLEMLAAWLSEQP